MSINYINITIHSEGNIVTQSEPAWQPSCRLKANCHRHLSLVSNYIYGVKFLG